MVRSQSAITALFFCLVMSFLLCSCAFTTTKVKNPDFSANLSTLSGNIRSIANFEKINIDGVEKTTNKVVTSQLNAKLINCLHAPETDGQIYDAGKKIAKALKAALKDQDQFDTYQIIFGKESTNGTGGSSGSYKGNIYKKDDL